jgi:hypothetical protein
VSQELRFYNEKSRQLDQEMNALKPEVSQQTSWVEDMITVLTNFLRKQNN